MLDVQRLKELLRRRGGSLEEFIRATGGISIGQLRRRLRESPARTPYGVVTALAAYLGVSPAALDPELPEWEPYTYFELDQLSRFHEEIGRAKECLTLTQGMESYLIEDTMLRWTCDVWLQTPIDAIRTKLAPSYIDQQIRALGGGVTHKVLAPETLLTVAAGMDSSWLGAMHGRLTNYRRTILGFVVDWAALRRALTAVLPTWAVGWDKMTIVDDTLVMIRPDRTHYWLSYRRPTVERIRTALNRHIPIFLPAFPVAGIYRPRAKAVQDARNDALDTISLLSRSVEG